MDEAKAHLICASRKETFAVASLEDAALELRREQLLDIRWARRRSMLLFARRTVLQAALLISALDGHLPVAQLLKSLV